MIIYVEDVESFVFHGSVATAEGTLIPSVVPLRLEGDHPVGPTVRFAGDWRNMRDLAEYIEVEGGIEVEVEDWQVLRLDDPALS